MPPAAPVTMATLFVSMAMIFLLLVRARAAGCHDNMHLPTERIISHNPAS
jgi:hypothetical protein